MTRLEQYNTNETHRYTSCFLHASVPDGLKTFANLGRRGQIAPSRPRSINLNSAITKKQNFEKYWNSTCHLKIKPVALTVRQRQQTPETTYTKREIVIEVPYELCCAGV